MSCCRVFTCFHFDAAGLKSEVWEELASREPGQAEAGEPETILQLARCVLHFLLSENNKNRTKITMFMWGWRKNILYSNNFFHANMKKNLFSLPPIQILDKKLFAQTIKGNVMVVPKPHVHSAILHLNRDCILYAFLPKYVDTKTFKVPTKSINTFRVNSKQSKS